MSLRIYVKGTPRFNSPHHIDQSSIISPQLNPLPPSKHPRPKPPTLPLEPKEPSVIFESLSPDSDDPLHISDEINNEPPQTQAKKIVQARKLSVNTRYGSNKRNQEQMPMRRNSRSRDKEVRTKHETQEAIRDFSRMVNSRSNLSEKQLKEIIKESDTLIMSLMEDIEKLNALLADKMKENEVLHSNNTQLEKTVKELRSQIKDADEEQSELEAHSEEISRLTNENMQLGHMVKKLTECNNEFAEEVNLLRELAGNSEKTLQKERDSFTRLKKKVEELLKTNDNLNNQVHEKSKSCKMFEVELQQAKNQVQKLVDEMSGKNQIIEDLKKSLVVVDFQSPQHNNPASYRAKDEPIRHISSFSGGTSTAIWSNIKMENSLGSTGEKVKEEIKELQRKYEGAKSDNEKLIKLVESNQQVIKGLRDSFVDLEKRSSTRYNEIKEIYENKLKAMESPKVLKERETHGDSTTKATSRIIADSRSPSQGMHSKKPSYGSAWKNKENMPVNVAFY